MVYSKIKNTLDYAKTLTGIPYRWHTEEENQISGTDKFWAENSAAPSANEIIENDKSIVCTGLINLMRRYNGLTIPGLNGNITGKHKKTYEKYPGGTGAWFLYLYQKKRLEKINLKQHYPNGTLLIARFKNNEKDQGHVAVVCDNEDSEKNLIDQLIIHSVPSISYEERKNKKNHGEVVIEPFHISNNKYKVKNKKTYYTYICLPENWQLID